VGTLHPPKSDAGANIYCPFSAVGDGGHNEYCTGGTEHCCETPADAGVPSSCEPIATACPALSMDWQCEDPVADCKDSAKPVCCAPGATIGLGNPGCGNFAHKMTQTTCVAAGSCAGIVMCTSDSECPSGQKCTAFSKAGNQVGGCM
jgi:Cys-rich repeat protein